MSGFRVSCSECKRETTVPREDVLLSPAMPKYDGRYRFPCPECGLISVKIADPHISKLLFDNGASLEGWNATDDAMLESLYG